MYPVGKGVTLREKWEMERRQGGEKHGRAVEAVGATGSSGQAHVLLFAPKTAVVEEGGCLGSTQTRLRRVRGPHSFILAVGAAAMLCSRLSGGWRCWRSTRMTLFWKYVPVEHSVSLSYPSLEPAKPLGPAPLAIALALSLITLLGKELARTRAKPARAVAPFGTLEPKTGFFLPFFFLPFFFLSQARFFGTIARWRG